MRRSNNLLKYPMFVLRGKFTQPLFWGLVFLGPLLNIFRVDTIAQRLIWLGKAYPFEWNTLMWLPITFYALVLVISVTSFIYGRLFCGWVCPHNAMTEWTRSIRAMAKLEEKPRWMKLLLNKQPWIEGLLMPLAIVLGLGITVGLSLLLSFYIVPPDWVINGYLTGKPHIALAFGNGLFTLIGLFLLFAGHNFCRVCCPYGLAQSVSAYHENTRWRPMEIRFVHETTDDCKSCTVCQQVCPVDIDPRDPANLQVGQFDGCFNCGECIDACSYIHDFKNTPGYLAFDLAGMKRTKVATRANHIAPHLPDEPSARIGQTATEEEVSEPAVLQPYKFPIETRKK